MEIIRGRFGSVRKVPGYAWAGCVLAGLSYVYIAFFSCVVLVCAAAIAWIGQRRPSSFWIGLMLAAGVGGAAMVDLAPAMIYEARNGANASMLFKSPAEVEVYGLKLRYLLTPSPDHPLALFRAVEWRLARAKFPFFENENEYTRLGLAGSLGWLSLIGLAMGALVNARLAERAASCVLGPCAALTLACLWLASTGGGSVFFNALVTPEIRAWARIFPFIGFFCVAAAGAIAGPYVARLPRVGGLAVVGMVTVLAVFDQAVPSSAYDRSDALYRHDAAFVKEIEKLLPADSAVFELPFVDFPNDNHPGSLMINDLLRPYLHSRKYRWSAGAVSGTTSAEWNRLVAGMAAPEMLNALVHSGFGGLWIDGAGYAVDQAREAEISRELGMKPVRDSGGRLLFYDLRRYAASVRGREAGMDVAQVRARNRVQAVFERGYYSEERGAAGVFRWSLRRGRVTLVNPLPVARRVTASMHLETADQRRHAVQVRWHGGSDRVQAPATYERQIEVPAGARYALDFLCECPGVEAVNRRLYFWVSGFGLRE